MTAGDNTGCLLWMQLCWGGLRREQQKTPVFQRKPALPPSLQLVRGRTCAAGSRGVQLLSPQPYAGDAEPCSKS